MRDALSEIDGLPGRLFHGNRIRTRERRDSDRRSSTDNRDASHIGSSSGGPSPGGPSPVSRRIARDLLDRTLDNQAGIQAMLSGLTAGLAADLDRHGELTDIRRLRFLRQAAAVPASLAQAAIPPFSIGPVLDDPDRRHVGRVTVGFYENGRGGLNLSFTVHEVAQTWFAEHRVPSGLQIRQHALEQMYERGGPAATGEIDLQIADAVLTLIPQMAVLGWAAPPNGTVAVWGASRNGLFCGESYALASLPVLGSTTVYRRKRRHSSIHSGALQPSPCEPIPGAVLRTWIGRLTLRGAKADIHNGLRGLLDRHRHAAERLFHLAVRSPSCLNSPSLIGIPEPGWRPSICALLEDTRTLMAGPAWRHGNHAPGYAASAGDAGSAKAGEPDEPAGGFPVP